MSKLSVLINDANVGLSVQQPLPNEMGAIAEQCGKEEIAEIEARIVSLKAELATV